MINPTQVLIGSIYADAITKQVPSAPMVVTSHPVEDGSVISEHIAEQQRTLILEATFTDDEVGVGGTGSMVTTSADDKRDAIYALKKKGDVFNVETIKDHYPDMALIDIQEEITPQNSAAFVATLVFEHIRIVKPGMNKVPLDKVKKKAAPKRNAGLKQEPTADQGAQTPEEVADARAAEDAAAAVGGVFAAAGA